MTNPAARRKAVNALVRRGLSQRKACIYLGLSRRVTHYRRMAAWLDVGEARVRRLWRELGLTSRGADRSVAAAEATFAFPAPCVPMLYGATISSTTKWSTGAA